MLLPRRCACAESVDLRSALCPLLHSRVCPSTLIVSVGSVISFSLAAQTDGRWAHASLAASCTDSLTVSPGQQICLPCVRALGTLAAAEDKVGRVGEQWRGRLGDERVRWRSYCCRRVLDPLGCGHMVSAIQHGARRHSTNTENSSAQAKEHWSLHASSKTTLSSLRLSTYAGPASMLVCHGQHTRRDISMGC